MKLVAETSSLSLHRQHLLYDIWVEDGSCLKWVEPLRSRLSDAIQKSGATIVGVQFHQFQPFGVTGIFMLAESHVSIHTWPEENFASLDVFTCGYIQADVIVEEVRKFLSVKTERLAVVDRSTTVA